MRNTYLFCVILTITIISTTSVYAQNDIQLQAIADAETDAKSNMDNNAWIFIGCAAPCIGITLPYLSRTHIPASKILGKSPEYVAFYTDAYKSKMLSLRFSNAVGGCLIGSSISVFSYLVIPVITDIQLWD